MSDETIELLRAHDPERAGAQAPPIELLLARVDAEPAAGREGSTRWRRSRRHGPRAPRPGRPSRVAVAVALVCLAAVAIGAVTAGGIVGSHGDVTAADDTTATTGVIVHTISRTTMGRPGRGRPGGPTMGDGHGGYVGTLDGPVERWSAAAPARWRTVTTLRSGRAMRSGRDMPGGTMEQAYARGVLRNRNSWDRRAWTQHVRDPDGSQFTFIFGGPAPMSTGRALAAGVADPRAAVLAMLDSGEVRTAGETTVHGRRALRLFGETARRVTGRGSFSPASRTTYLVDAETYVPIEVSVKVAYAFRGRGPLRFTPSSRTVFERYENLPLDASTEHLLRFGG